MIVPPRTTPRRTTSITTLHDLRRERLMLALLLPSLKWRWHGIGLLQGYIHEDSDRDGYELRAHIWSRELVLPGIAESGSAHDHRFLLQSTVLAGTLEHTELHLSRDDEGDHETWTFPHARLHNEANRGLMERTGERFWVKRRRLEITQGQRYRFERGAFHTSVPLSDLVVTLVEKFDQREIQARVVAPVGSPPVPSFGYSHEARESIDVQALVGRAVRALRAPPA